MQKVMEKKTELEVGQTVPPVWTNQKALYLLEERINSWMPVFFNVKKMKITENGRVLGKHCYEVENLKAEIEVINGVAMIIFSDEEGAIILKDDGRRMLSSFMETSLEEITYENDQETDLYTIKISFKGNDSILLEGTPERE